MQVCRLEIERLRCLSRVSISPGSSLNIIAGANGSGKTSVLEGLYLLGLGRSFRSRQARDIVTWGEESLTVFGEVREGEERYERIGVERGRAGTRVRVGGKDVKVASSLARVLPLVLITPESQRLLTNGTRLRRRMVDWALFHVEPGYQEVLGRYRAALRHRNALLRSVDRGGRELGVWEEEMERGGEALHRWREGFAEELKAPLQRQLDAMLGFETEVSYFAGWDVERRLSEVLEERRGRDRERGYTSSGPHRADVRFRVNGQPAEQVLSRGEGKLFVTVLLLAQTALVVERAKRVPVVLVDDLPSELDEANRGKLLRALEGSGAQAFVTAVSERLLKGAQIGDHKLFHVERGQVRLVI